MSPSSEILHGLFLVLVGLHIAAGAPGLVLFWIPIVAKKGGPLHRFWGRLFACAMLFAATMALFMSSLSVAFPKETHPHLASHPVFSDPALIRGIFGWMMLYLAVLTINLAWYGWSCIRNRADHARNRGFANAALQAGLLLASANCAYQGWIISQPMMLGISLVGFATVATNLWFILNPKPGPVDWLFEHIKGIVGVGISVYTAFFAFGAVRLAPWLALNPILWAVPLSVGLGLILYYRRQIYAPLRRPRSAPAE
jgi:hypothetical protein